MPDPTEARGDPLDAVDICICTHRRESVVQTLESLARLQGLGPRRRRVIVVDNDETPSSEARVRETAARAGLPLLYRHAPAHNIALARNACLDAAEAPWIAFIDDDETATPAWLEQLLAEAAQGGWDTVLGPTRALYEPGAPAWMRRGDFHSIAPVLLPGGIETGYTCNTLIRRAAVERAGLRFDLQFGRSGGEDLDFFYRLRDAGGRIGFAPEAWTEEPVPPHRARLGWLLTRAFRSGQSHGTRLVRSQGGGFKRVANGLVAAGKLAYCAAGAVLSAPRAHRRNRFMTRGALHLGVVARIAGVREVSLY